MGNSRKPEGSTSTGKAKKENSETKRLTRTGQTVADAGATARRAIAITRGGRPRDVEGHPQPGIEAARRESRHESRRSC